MADIELTEEEFWEEFKPILFPEKRREEAEEEVEKIIELGELDSGMKVLDMPCGIGRHSLILDKKGFEVVGVDKTRSYIDEARDENDSGSVEFVRSDMKDFSREENFDAVINWWNSFGYFEDRANDRKMMENIYSSLKDGGKLLMDMVSKEIMAMNNLSKRWSEIEGVYNLEESKPVYNWKKVENTWIKIEDGEESEYTWEQRLYAASELETMMKDIGFSKVTLYGNVDMDDFDDEAERLIVVAEK